MMKGGGNLPNITSQVMVEVCGVIYKCPDDTPPVVMEYCVNDEHEDSTRKYLVEKNYTKVTNEVREISIETENEDVIHRNITDIETEKNWIPIKR